MSVLARRTLATGGRDLLVGVVDTGNGPALRVTGCPMLPLSLSETHRLLSGLGRTTGEGITDAAETLVAALEKLA